MKSNTDRFGDVLEIMDKHFKNDKVKELVQQRIDNLGAKKKAIGDALSLGSRDDKTAAETERRQALRALLFLLFTEGRQPVTLASGFIARYETRPLHELLSIIKQHLPLYVESPYRNTWDAGLFSAVSNPPPPSYRYVVFGLMNTYTGRGISYEKLIANPSIVQTFLLSTSVISSEKISTYYPYGFILSVPKENVISTSSSDQAFKNYKAGTGVIGPPTLSDHVDSMDMRTEVRRVGSQSAIQSPDTILGGTKGTGGMSGYNEIVVMGTTPTGSKVTVKGFFMKVDSKGNRWVRPDSSKNEPFVTDDIYAKMKQTNLPIVEITDIKGKNA
jgi:hypothetical protein